MTIRCLSNNSQGSGKKLKMVFAWLAVCTGAQARVSIVLWFIILDFYATRKWNSEASSFCPHCDAVFLSVWLWQKNFYLGYNFWTVRDRDFIFGMHTQLMKPFQMTTRSVTLIVAFILKIANCRLCCRRGHSCFTSTPVLLYSKW